MAGLAEFEVRIGGEGVRPDTLDAREVIELLDGFTRALLAVAGQRGARPKLFLTEVVRGSSGYAFASDDREIADDVRVLAAGLKGQPPARHLSAVREWRASARKFTERRRVIVLFPTRGEEPVLTIPDDLPEVETPYVRGRTVVFGEIQRIGGATKATAAIRLDDGQLLTCDLDRELARTLGPHLYRRVGLSGTADWDPDTWELAGLQVEEIEVVDQADVLSALDAIARAGGREVWGDDPAKAILEWRKDT